jgi:hypothetical protein
MEKREKIPKKYGIFNFRLFFSYLDHHIDHGQEKRNFEDKEVRFALEYTVLCSTVLYCVVWYCVVLFCFVLCCVATY